MPAPRRRLDKKVQVPGRKAKADKARLEGKGIGHAVRKAKKVKAVSATTPAKRTIPWDDIRQRYVQGYERHVDGSPDLVRYYPTLLELAYEFKVSPHTINSRCGRGEWAAMKDEWQVQLRKAKDDAALAAIHASELRIRGKALRAAEKIIDKVAGVEGDETGNVQGFSGLLSVCDPSDLASLSAALRRGQEVANVAIGLPKDGVKAPTSDMPGAGQGNGNPTGQTTVWARMRAARQEILVGVRVVNE
jgi:hypothetical protein